jgi:hypothetical protein
MSLVAALTPAFGEAARKKIESKKDIAVREHNYAGLWVTGDGYIRHELLANGRYIEARGTRENAFEGEYWINGDHIDYRDDTGFTADGDFRDGILFHADMVLYRRDN